MAEEVKIVDVAGGPAAEATLQEILKIMKQRGGGGGGGTASAAKAQELYTTAVTRGTTVRKENTAAVKENTESFSLLSSTVGVVGGAFGLLFKALGATTGIVFNFGSAVANATSIGEFLDAVPVFGSLLSQASGYFDQSLNTFRDLSQVGAGFGNDMMAMRNASAEAGLSLEQFASVISNNSSTMGYLGSSTSDGAARFGRLTKALRSQEAGLLRLGFTQESLNEGMAEYLENQALAGQLRGRSDASLIAGAQNYLTELDKLARVTGKSRQELQDAMRANAQVANMAVIRSRLDGEALTRFDANAAHMSTMLPTLNSAFQDLSDGVAQSPLARVLESNVPGFKRLAEMNARGEITQEQFQAELQRLTPQIRDFITGMDPSRVEALVGREGFGELMNSIGEVTSYTQRSTEAAAAAAEQARRSDLTSIYANFGQVLQNVRSNIENALIDSGILPKLGKMLTSLTSTLMEVVTGITNEIVAYLRSPEFAKTIEDLQTWLKGLTTRVKLFIADIRSGELKVKIDQFIQGIKDAWTAVSGFVSDVSNIGLSGAIAKALGGDEGQSLGSVIIDKITTGIENLWNDSGLIGKIGIGLAGLFTAGKVVGFLTDSIGGLFRGASSVLGSLGGGGGGRGGGGNATRGGRAAGSGVADFAGQVGGGVLSGIARGIAAFASPQVAIGAAVLAGTILVIGAAVAGATWLVGSALPTFSEGMKSFEDLDGAKLQAAGNGMLAVAGGMAAFGAGSAVAGIGAAVGAIGDAVAGLFGAEDPMEKLLRFQSYNFDQARIEGNANAMVAFSTAMAAQGAGAAASGLGGAVGAIGSAIAGFFGGDTGIPYDDIIEFQQYAFDTEKIRANAAAMVAFNQALTSSSGAQASSGMGNAVGAIGNAIASFFGADTPFDQVREFGALDINAEGVARNAQAMVAMANALNAFTGGSASEIEIPQRTVTSLQRLSEMGGTGTLGTLATDLTRIAQVQGLGANITALNSLDAESVRSYNTAMERLVETLEELNEVLAEDNEGTRRNPGTGVSAANIMANLQSETGSGTGSTEQLDRLNMLVAQLVTLQQEGNRYTRGTMRAVNGNLQVGI